MHNQYSAAHQRVLNRANQITNTYANSSLPHRNLDNQIVTQHQYLTQQPLQLLNQPQFIQPTPVQYINPPIMKFRQPVPHPSKIPYSIKSIKPSMLRGSSSRLLKRMQNSQRASTPLQISNAPVISRALTTNGAGTNGSATISPVPISTTTTSTQTGTLVPSQMYILSNTANGLNFTLASPVFNANFNAETILEVKAHNNFDGTVTFTMVFQGASTLPHYPVRPTDYYFIPQWDLDSPIFKGMHYFQSTSM